MLRQRLLDRARGAERTLGSLWRLARHPRVSANDARTAADIFRNLCDGGLVVSTAFPTPAQIARIKAVPAAGRAADAAARAAEAQALTAILAEANTRGAAAGDNEPIALRTILQIDGDLAFVIDQGFALRDGRVFAALVQVHLAAVREALQPLVRAQRIAAALRGSVFVAVPASGVASGAVAHWLVDLFAMLLWSVATAALTGGFFFTLRWWLERRMRSRISNLLGR